MLHDVQHQSIAAHHDITALSNTFLCCSHLAPQATLADRRTPDAAALAVYDSAVQLQDKVGQRCCLRLHARVAIVKLMAVSFRSNGCSSAWRP